jgi:hypothetical protein
LLVLVCIYAFRRYEQWDTRIAWCIALFNIASLSLSIIASVAGFALPISGCVGMDERIEAVLLLAPTLSGLLAAWLCGSTKYSLVLLCSLVGIEAGLTIGFYVMGMDHFISGDVLRASGTYTGPASLYRVLVPTLPLCVGLVFCARNEVSKCTWTYIAVLVALALILTWYRGGIVAASLAMLFFVIRLRLEPRWIVFLVLVSMGLIGSTFGLRVHNEQSALSARRSAASRVFQAQMGWREFICHPIFGIGRGAATISVKVGVGNDTSIARMPGPPNQLLFALAEGGIFEALLLLVFFVVCLRITSRMHSPLGWGLTASWIGIAFCGITDIAFGATSSIFCPINCVIGILTGATLLADNEDSWAKL